MIVVDGDVVVAGSYMSIDGDTIRGIARWRRSTGEWESIGGGLNVDNSGTIWAAFVLEHSGSIYVGGDFQRAGTLAVSNAARWNGVHWHQLASAIVEERFIRLVARRALTQTTCSKYWIRAR